MTLGGSCSWWNTVTVTGIGQTKGAAEADLFHATAQAINDGTIKGCRSLGVVEFSDWKIFTFARQSFCCDSSISPVYSIY